MICVYDKNAEQDLGDEMSVALENIDHEQVYNEITKIYDFTEVIIDAIELQSNQYPEFQVELFGPIIERLQDAADILTESYVNFIETGEKPSRSESLKIERIVRKAYISVDEMLEKLGIKGK